MDCAAAGSHDQLVVLLINAEADVAPTDSPRYTFTAQTMIECLHFPYRELTMASQLVHPSTLQQYNQLCLLHSLQVLPPREQSSTCSSLREAEV